MSERKNSLKKGKINKYIKLFFSGAAGTGLFYLILFVFTFIALKLDLTSSMYMPAGLISGAIAGLLSGYTSVVPFREKGLVYGSAGGLICVILCGTVSFAVNGGKAGAGLIIICAVIFAFSVIGGILAVSKNPRRKR